MLAVPLAVSLLYFQVDQPNVNAPLSEISDVATTTPLTLLIAGQNADEPPGTIVLLQIDPTAGELPLAVIPPETLVEDAGKLDALALVWKREGGRRAAAALAAALDVSIERWLTLSQEGFIHLADTVGTVDYVLEHPLTLTDGSVLLPAGRQVLDGRKLLTVFSYQGYPGGEPERLSTVAQALTATLNQRIGLMNTQSAEAMFQTAVNEGKSNLTIADFESRRRSASLLRARSGPARIVPFLGEYNAAGNTFLLSTASAKAMIEAFA
ncbi:MAG: LCP family protein [Oscillospiraceae bacterium]